MARKKPNAPDSKETSGFSLKSVADALRAATEKSLPSMASADSFIMATYGIPLTGNIPLQYLMGIDVLPLERTMSLVGKEGTLKSSLGWYLANLFLDYQVAKGLVFFINTEVKVNEDIIRGIIQNDPVWNNFVFRSDTSEMKGVEEARHGGSCL